jgi:hypothetical protein
LQLIAEGKRGRGTWAGGEGEGRGGESEGGGGERVDEGEGKIVNSVRCHQYESKMPGSVHG